MKKILYLILLISLSLLAGYFLNKVKTNVKNEPAKLIIGTSPDNPPFEFLSNGRVIGFDMDLADMIADKMGMKYEIYNMDFFGLIPALNNKKIDFVIAGLSKSELREKQISYSKVYLKSKVAILVQKNSGITKFADFENKIVGAQLGTTWENYAKSKKQEGLNIQIKSLSSNNLLVEELKKSNIDGLVMEEFQARQISRQNKELDYFELTDFDSEFVIAFPKDSELVGPVNKILDELSEDGSIDILQDKWFGENNARE